MHAGERDLGRLVEGLRPTLHPQRYTFAETSEALLGQNAFALVREAEGLTVVRADPTGEWARISLEVHSSLEAVGLTAVVSRTLGDAGISVNVVAALRHDHLFVPWERRQEALGLLEELSAGAH